MPFLHDLLHTKPLPITDLVIACALSTLGYAAVRLDRIVHRDKTAATAQHRGREGLTMARTHKTLIWERNRQVQRLRHQLREYFPAALEAFDDLDAPDAGWPSWCELGRADQ